MNNGEVNRRTFVKQTSVGLAGLLIGPWALDACVPSPAQSLDHIGGGLRGANHAVGHLLRSGASLPLPTQTVETDVLIVGGGIAGLSAKRWLHRRGVADVLLMEMDNGLGGNSAYGQNAVSAYPWGAHYLPVPDPRNRELLDFLAEIGTITGFNADGLPIYNEYHLCHDPQERLLIHGYWQEGLVPDRGVPAADKAQIARFFGLVDQLKRAVGNDGRDAFAIPLDRSSADPQYRRLDQQTFAEYLTEQGFTSPYLRWYLNYTCKDDYGATLDTTSAWAGLHYFASRKGQGQSVTASDVLTWPQGNGFLLDYLKPKPGQSAALTNRLAYDLREVDGGVRVLTYDTLGKKTVAIQARKVLLATPQFVTRHLLKALDPDRAALTDGFHYAPWVVANLTVDALPQGKGMPLCWDNVGYGTASVGYITANNQDLSDQPKRVITVYWPLTDTAPDLARRQAYQTTYADWLQKALAELETLHPGVTAHVREAEVVVWGHGMIAPTPGFIWGEARQRAMQPIRDRIFFAHSDLSGVSIFEEAFYQGIRAAEKIRQSLAIQV